jgi:hypothetical protein
MPVVALATGRATLARQVKGDGPHKRGYPGPPCWGLGMGLTTPPHKKKKLLWNPTVSLGTLAIPDSRSLEAYWRGGQGPPQVVVLFERKEEYNSLQHSLACAIHFLCKLKVFKILENKQQFCYISQIFQFRTDPTCTEITCRRSSTSHIHVLLSCWNNKLTVSHCLTLNMMKR